MSLLNIKENSFITNRSSDGITDPIDKAIDKYKFHPSILLIPKHLKNHDVFSFRTAEIGVIEKEIKNINPKEATTSNSIPPKILKSLPKLQHGTIIGTQITCKKIFCYMHDSAYRWLIVKKGKLF